ncbi:UDP-GlcNAc:betaGal beta-1,3-N-acetylglucosaminyltransferase 9 [Megalobrama amblycephala]|uniref:UDP-GlcNAc:betaGal beta-1,3-N-acetylglucosaminyltransferase 9 n=1 Tax=Megalobrama amblycephala TaxID=75352 RepID=UPI002013C47A|nr:UDP-GlcNAc:betaGal beta-1,3-N-acetylglucosaminyltransferase 9 [Megalobrama amblycephala]XP_048024550.1 UDP-GlcNAc:betaGal beta-1,3-N-acetylglucosaminyltransferase 9 [Megalobrama amblycephala]XP_048024551.1 UDP-GlcNAc:betaGal beta-1,3-N-acetylglucosaminyltransferase 9 [Megalobrama amblycephala]XP_048024552.1 UDP-GlcNAc:betaGal beta-1,3-N-acetylglucosaminyltransferase 9 [Megalobrama amblycephala]
MRRVHIKGDVLCSLILLVLLFLLLYAHQRMTPVWGTLHIEQGSTSSRTLLGGPSDGLETKPFPSKSPDIPLCKPEVQIKPKAQGPSKVKSQKGRSKAKSKFHRPSTTASLLPTQASFDFYDYLRKKDQREFKLLIDQPTKCSGPEGAPYMLIAIKSVATDFDKRQVVRRTWGREGVFQKDVNVRRVFLLGVPQNKTALPLWDKLLGYESHTFHDILLWDFEDTFFNLTLKEIHFLQWINVSCPKVKFIFKGDTDVYVNIDNILEMLEGQKIDKDLFVGDIIVHAKPIRRRNSKYFIPEFIYGQGIYPSYAGGGGFVMSGHTALKLHLACKEVELFPIDDVFLGMCLLRINLQPTRHEGFRTFGIVRPSAAPHLQVFDPCFYRELMVVHSLTVPQIWLMWNLLHDPNLQCHSSQDLTGFPFQWRDKMVAKNKAKEKLRNNDYGIKVFVEH